MKRRLPCLPRPGLTALAAALLVLALAAGAIAYFTSTGTGTASASVGTINAPTDVTAQQTGANVNVSWSAATLSSGAAVQGYRVTRSDNTTVCGTPTPVTTLSCTDMSVPAGSYTYTVTAVYNTFTAQASSASITSLSAPTITQEPSNPSANPSPSFSFSGGGGSGYECQLDSGSYTACSSPDALSGLTDGSHTLKVRATGGGGTSGPAGSYTWTIDTTVPSITAEPANPSASGSPSFSFAHTESAYTFKCALDSGGYTACASPKSYSVVAGSHTFAVEAVDGDGIATAAASYTWTVVTTGPGQSLALASGASDAYLQGTTLYYNGNAGSSFALTDTVTTASLLTTPASAAFPGIATSGWTHPAQTVSTPAGGPYTSSTFGAGASATAPSGYTITATDTLGLSSATSLTFTNDSTAPTGGALSVNGTTATTAGSTSTTASTSFPIDSRTDYHDSQSGIASSTLTIQSETLTSGTCGAAGSGGPFTTATGITGTTQPTGITAGDCYLYTLTGTDNVGNTASVSTTVAVPSPPTITAVSPAQGLDGATNLLVTVTGTNFPSDSAVTSSGAGITVNSTTYNSATQLTANITIASSAATGARDITVTSQGAGSSVTDAGAFTIASRPAAALFVADNFFATVGDYSIAANGQLTSISGGPSGANGQGISVTPDGRFAYVSNAGAASISQYSVAADGTMSSLSPATVPAGNAPRGEAISADGRSLYVADYDDNAISEFTINSDGTLTPKSPATVTTAPGGTTGYNPWGIALSPDGHALFAADYGGGVVTQYLIGAGGVLSANSPATVPGGAGPMEIAVSPDGANAYVSNYNDGTLSQYTITNDSLTANSPATVNAGGSGAQPHDVVVSPDAKSVYVADFNSNSASVVWQYSIGAGGALTSQSPATVSAGAGPWAAAISLDGSYFYVADLGGSPAGAISEFSVGTGGALSALSPSQLVPSSDRSPFAMVVEGAMQIGNAATLPDAAVGALYSQPLWSLSGTAPVTYTLTSGSLPNGLSLSTAGVISGTPTTSQSKTFTVTATDSSATPQTSQKVFTLTVQ